MLDANTQQLWLHYIAAERDRIRDVMMPALERFIRALQRLDQTNQHDWAFQLAENIVDRGADTPVRFPLFEQVVLPALVAGVTHERPGCARWLAHFESLLANAEGRVALPQHLRSVTGLLREAIRLDPSDHKARHAFVELRASYLEYTTHELPAGILYGHDGATVVECDKLVQELAEFREQVELLHGNVRFAALIAECNLHFHRYREYLASGRPGGSYEHFVAERD